MPQEPPKTPAGKAASKAAAVEEDDSEDDDSEEEDDEEEEVAYHTAVVTKSENCRIGCRCDLVLGTSLGMPASCLRWPC